MTESKNEDIRETGWEIILAALGGMLVLDALIAKFAFADGGVNSAICAAASLLLLLPPLLKIIYEDFRHGRVHMNELVLIAVTAGVCRGDILTAGMIAFFMLVALIIETRSATGARKSLEAIGRMTALKARRIGSGREEEIEASLLVPGDIVRVRPGETIPADGEIVSGDSSIQESNITGESIPVDKTAGAFVFAGTSNLSGLLEVRVSRTGSDTTLGKVKELILSAERTRPRFIRMIDRYARYYTPAVIVVAFFIWAVTGHDLVRLVAVLVASCPIALVLSTPSASVAALSAGARLGVLIRNISDIESFSSVTSFIFDKTGTLTTGELEVSELAPSEGIDSQELLRIAASAEKDSNHPVARAICSLASKVNVRTSPSEEMKEKPGRGVRAVIGGEEILAGNRAWMEENGIPASEFPESSRESNSGMSLLFVVRNRRPVGWIALADRIRPDAKGALTEISGSGISSLAMVTGDRNGVAAKVAGELGIADFYGECSPSDKIAKVGEYKGRGYRTVFVGDGVNDAPALAASDIGVAMGAAGSDLAVETATVALMNNELDRLPFLLRLARAYRNVMYQNFFLGALFIAGGVAAGAMGYLGAVPAACLQVLSALVVVMNSARLVRMENTRLGGLN